MTDDIQALRDWSARKMGWCRRVRFTHPLYRDSRGYYAYNGKRTCNIDDWHPDTDLNQCFTLVERMRELGWFINSIHETPHIENPWNCHLLWPRTGAPYTKDALGIGNTPALAILKAARTTEDV